MSAELTYELEPELRHWLPRPARVKAQELVALRGMALFVLVIALVIAWYALRDLDDLYTLRAHGVTEQAVITNRRMVHGKSDHYYLGYWLQTHNGLIEDEEEVSESAYQRKRSADTAIVTFLPVKPQTHRLGWVGDERVQDATTAWVFGLLAWLGSFG